MIVTRQRRKPFPYKRLILPLFAVGLVVVALLWPPSRNVITAGPMKPAWESAGSAMDKVAAPFHFAAQNDVITDRNRQIAALQSQLTAAQNGTQGKDKQIAALQQQIDQLQEQAAAARTTPSKTAPRPAVSAGAFTMAAQSSQSNPVVSGDLSAGATADMRRTAQYWASMDPENAAKIAQRLPPSYVARVFALMQPDAVGAVLDALPANFAAKLIQEHPELQR